MTNAETITKLNDALEKLINAYEILQNSYDDLQNDNKKLNDEIKNLKSKVNELEEEKRNLEDNVNVLEDTKEKDTNNMNNMLTKIESLLGKKKPSSETDAIKPNENKVGEESQKNDTASSPSAVKDARAAMGEIVIDSKSSSEKNEESENSHSSSENKIDLNRMASLLNGFNS